MARHELASASSSSTLRFSFTRQIFVKSSSAVTFVAGSDTDKALKIHREATLFILNAPAGLAHYNEKIPDACHQSRAGVGSLNPLPKFAPVLNIREHQLPLVKREWCRLILIKREREHFPIAAPGAARHFRVSGSGDRPSIGVAIFIKDEVSILRA